MVQPRSDWSATLVATGVTIDAHRCREHFAPEYGVTTICGTGENRGNPRTTVADSDLIGSNRRDATCLEDGSVRQRANIAVIRSSSEKGG
jgi:hypothetical protein